MKNQNIALITSAAGHGLMELHFAQIFNNKIVACSDKRNKEEFEKETDDIYNRLSSFVPNMRKASWEQVEQLAKKGISYKHMLLNKQIDSLMWDKFAQNRLSPTFHKNLPQFNGLNTSKHKVLLIPQKLISDELCGVSAKNQSVPLSSFNFFTFEKHNQYILGQHFHMQNDLELVNNIAKDFSMYVPGQHEDTEVFGIRGVPHNKFLNLYNKTDMSVGIAGTHTWLMLTCFPDIPQIILYNKNGVENWQEITKSYQKQGKQIYGLGFDENTDWKKFSLEIKALYTKIYRSCNKDDNTVTRATKPNANNR